MYFPPQFNHRTEQGAGGLNVRCLTPTQEALIKQWQKIGHKSSLPYMLLNHMTLDEQAQFAAVYATTGQFPIIEDDTIAEGSEH